MGKPKSVGRLPLTSRQESPPSSLRMTSQCFCMKSTPGRDGCMAMRCTQWPTSASGSGIPWDLSPRLIGCQVAPPSSVRNAPAAEIATYIRPGRDGSSTIVCRHIPPAPGCQEGPVPCRRSPGSSCQLAPPSVDRNRAASSTPAYTVSGSVSDGSKCHTRAKAQGCWVPSYHWWVPASPSYSNLLPTAFQVAPPSSERWTTCPNHPLDCEAYSRLGSAGDPLTW